LAEAFGTLEVGAVAADDEAFHDQEIKVIKNNSPVNLFRV